MTTVDRSTLPDSYLIIHLPSNKVFRTVSLQNFLFSIAEKKLTYLRDAFIL